MFLTFSMFIIRGARCVLLTSNICSRNPLVTLGVSGRSHCGLVRILRSLASPSRHFVRVRSLSFWRGAHFGIAHATVSSLWACRIALVEARCEFWDRSRNPLVTLCGSDRSRSGALLILGSLMQPSCHFGRAGSLSLRRGANSEIARATLLALWACQIALLVARCFMLIAKDCTESLPGGLLERSCQQSSYRSWYGDPTRSCQETSDTELVQTSCQKTSYRDLAQRHCIEICWHLTKRALLESLCKISETDRAKRPPIGSLCRDIV